MTTEIDETTGLPELPEGEFWRVTDGYDNKYHYVQLRKKGKFLWFNVSYKITDELIFSGLSQESILEASYRIIRRIEDNENNQHLIGNYPPNSLEVDG